MRLAIDAITQAEGAAPAAVSTPASPALPLLARRNPQQLLVLSLLVSVLGS
jgi:hypothetical protein